MIKYNLMEGKNPRTEEPMFYAMAAPVTTIKLEGLAEEISQECTVTAHDIRAVISAMEEKIITHLQNGQSIRLGLLGSFCPTIRSRSSRTPRGLQQRQHHGHRRHLPSLQHDEVQALRRQPRRSVPARSLRF